MKRNVAWFVVVLLVAAGMLTGCRFAQKPSSADREPYPYASQLPRTTPAFTAPARVPANVNPGLEVPILMYHEVALHTPGMSRLKQSLLVTPEEFARQMQYLKDNGFTTVTLDDWMAARAGRETFPAKPVILTFDDGRIGIYENAFPILRRNGQKAILFLITGEVGRVVKGYVSWAMVQEMESTGLITVGSHTVHHVALTTVSIQRALSELSYSKMAVQRKTRLACNYFCYPFGKYDVQVAKLVAAVGYRAATSELPGWSRVSDNTYELHRVRIDGRDSMNAFDAKLRLH